MSKYGRTQDALWDLLWGIEDGAGAFHPGPLHVAEPTAISELINRIIEVVAGTLYDDYNIKEYML